MPMSGQGANHPASYIQDGSGRDGFVANSGTRLTGKSGHMCAVDSTVMTPRSPRRAVHGAEMLRSSGFESLRTTTEWAKSPRLQYSVRSYESDQPNPWSKHAYRSTYREGFNVGNSPEEYEARYNCANGVRHILHGKARGAGMSSGMAKRPEASPRPDGFPGFSNEIMGSDWIEYDGAPRPEGSPGPDVFSKLQTKSWNPPQELEAPGVNVFSKLQPGSLLNSTIA